MGIVGRADGKNKPFRGSGNLLQQSFRFVAK
jgi:hypothetical protein